MKIPSLSLLHFSRSVFLLTALFAMGYAATSEAADQTSQGEKPNIIFIIVDDQKRDQFGFLSPKTALTPNIDRLANEGIFFKNGFATSTVCTPSRYTCLTGRYPSQCSAPVFKRDITKEGMTSVLFNTYVELDRPNVPRVLKDSGYVTGLVGKWHIGAHNYKEEVPAPDCDPKDPEVIAMMERNQVALSNTN